MRANGFAVDVEEAASLHEVRSENSMPESLRSCHTATVDGYVVEGHVPATDVMRLLNERPNVVGLAVPGMPVGSPCMEIPGAQADGYEVVTFDASGATGVFAKHNWPIDLTSPDYDRRNNVTDRVEWCRLCRTALRVLAVLLTCLAR